MQNPRLCRGVPISDLGFSQPPVNIPTEQGVAAEATGTLTRMPTNWNRSAAHRDGGQHPDGGQTHVAAHHTGVDHVALELLKAQKEDQKDQGLQR